MKCEYEITTYYISAQVFFMNDIMRFQKEDKGNRKGTDIKVSFKQIYTK